MYNDGMLTELFVDVDDFCQEFEPKLNARLLALGQRSPTGNESALSESEIMTIVVYYHLSGMRTFKYFYQQLGKEHIEEFPNLVSYQRFVELMRTVTVHLYAYLAENKGSCSGVSFVDSTKIQVCGNKRINRNRVFAGIAELGKSTMGWFFGFKLHLVINDLGEILNFHVTAGNVDDRDPLDLLFKGIHGKVFGDKGYISKEIFDSFLDRGVQLITTLKKNMKPKIMPIIDKILLRKRSIIETVNDFLKNTCQIEHTRHRSPYNFFVNLLAGLVAYSRLPKKPSIRFDCHEELEKELLMMT
jgi:hypothetical protein